MTQPLHIGNVIRNAHTFNMRNWQGAAQPMDDLLQSVAELFTLLHQRNIASVLVGGIALLQYIQGRNTEDIDLIIAVSSLKRLPEIQMLSQDDNFARGQYKGLQIDFFLTKNPVFARVQKKYTVTQRFLERDIVSATVEGLLILKLYAIPSLYRQNNFARVGLYENDVATLMYYYKPAMPAIERELARYVQPADMQAIQSIMADIQVRITRFQQQASGVDESEPQ